ncbi:MAG: WD40 repeat domain-containing protein, partial [Candidatus Obscuribacterales bacterium]|nr:WD40 repeat domain-containing protein [Candidatus Obscuribacterales bacterium]
MCTLTCLAKEGALIAHKRMSTSINVLVFSPDGMILASGGDNQYIKLWDVSSGRERHSLDKTNTSALAFTPDGKTLAGGTSDYSIKFWDVASGRDLSTSTPAPFEPGPLRGYTVFRGHSDTIWCLAFSPNGKLLASGSGDHLIRLWNVTSGKQLRTFTCSGTVESVAFSADGKTLASVDSDNHLSLWNLATGKKMRDTTGRIRFIGPAFSPAGKWFTIENGSIRLRDVVSGQES